MSAGKTVSFTFSFTAPASFWYLQHFPVKAMSEVADYVIFMAYDLHGQWDYGNPNSDPGCLGRNCLCSHVNLTETVNTLSMVTKAGVPSNMIAVGVASYGRCWTEESEYTGPLSGAEPGICTGTGGYLGNYEIDLISAENPTAMFMLDETTFSNIVVWNETQWVPFMNDSIKSVRQGLYTGLSFLGIADWTADLQGSGTSGDSSSTGSNSSETVYVNTDIWASKTPIVTALPGVTLVWPPMPLSFTTTISLPPLMTVISYSSLTTTTATLADSSTSTYPWYIYASYVTVLSVPAVTTTAIPVWGVSLSLDEAEGTIYLTSSVRRSPSTLP
ncbi:glycoside hydrolase superfamily [Xylaria arbuscula]|nr:glycoside hydrolase superfamily [Xylaria arbuscula]